MQTAVLTDCSTTCDCGVTVYVATSWRGDLVDVEADGRLHDCGQRARDLLRTEPVPEPKKRPAWRTYTSPETTARIRRDVLALVAERPGISKTALHTSVRGGQYSVCRVVDEMVADGSLVCEASQRWKAGQTKHAYYPPEAA